MLYTLCSIEWMDTLKKLMKIEPKSMKNCGLKPSIK